MPVDPADYPETTRGYPYPTLINPGGAEANAATDVPADLKRLADAVDADVAAVESVAGSASGTVASDLAAHVADSTGVHGIADTSVLVTTARTITAGTGLTGGGTLAADRTLTVAYGTDAGTAAQGNDARLSDTRTPTDGTVTTAKIADDAVTVDKIAAGAVGTTELANDAVTTGKIATGAVGTTDIADLAVTDGKLAGSITPSKVTGTAVVQARTITAGTGLSGGGDLSANRTIAIAAGGVGTTELADASVTPAKLLYSSGFAPLGIQASATGVTLDRGVPVYTFTGGSVSATLPTASTHTGVRFLIRNAGSGTVTVAGITGLTIPGTGYVDVVSDGAAWLVLDGAYSTNTVGLTSYRWNGVSAAWRLIAYDTGWRDVSTLLNATHLTENTAATAYIRRNDHNVEIRYDQGAGGTTTGSAKAMYAIPVGFRTAVGLAIQCGSMAVASGAIVLEGAYVGVGSAALLTSSWTAVRHTLAVQFMCTDTLPTSLPGTQTSAPV